MRRRLNQMNLDETIQWYEGRTNSSRNGRTVYELTLEALKLLRSLNQGKARPGASQIFPNARCILEHGDVGSVTPEPPKLNERQAQVLYLIQHDARIMVDTKRSGSIIDKLTELGALNEWREVTDLGRAALIEYARR